MKIRNHYNELIIAVDLQDTRKFEKLLSYSDCRNELLHKYIQNFGIENVRKLTQNIEAKALKVNLEKICSECKVTECDFLMKKQKVFKKQIFTHQKNIDSNTFSHNYKQLS